MAYFPMFIDLTNKKCLIVGGGNLALHKAEILLDFDASVYVVASEICDEIISLSEKSDGKLTFIRKHYDNSDCVGMDLVVCATDDSETNRNAAKYCKNEGIPINVVDQKESCSFIFPSYIKEKNLVAAFSSGGNSPLITQILKEEGKRILTPKMGDINEILGEYRSYVKTLVADTQMQSRIYRKIYDELINNKTMSKERVQEIIKDEI